MNSEFGFDDYWKIIGNGERDTLANGIRMERNLEQQGELPSPLTSFIFDQQGLKNYMGEQQIYPVLLPDKHNWYLIKQEDRAFLFLIQGILATFFRIYPSTLECLMQTGTKRYLLR